MRLATNIHHVSGNCWEGFQGERSRSDQIECYHGGGLHFDGVASRPTCCNTFFLPGMQDSNSN